MIWENPDGNHACGEKGDGEEVHAESFGSLRSRTIQVELYCSVPGSRLVRSILL